MAKINKAPGRAEFPGQAGIDSKEIEALIKDFGDSGIELHSLMILRHGKVAFEGYAAPYGRDTAQAMYTISESVTAIAMVFALSEGLIDINSKVIGFFPEYRPSSFDEKLEKLTVYHLMTMTAGKAVSRVPFGPADTAKRFFSSPWSAEPGKKWADVKENAYICSAIITKITGMSLTDYLMPRLFAPLGFEKKPEWETDKNGITAGGWGLRLTTEELAKIILCVQQGGMYDGKQVIPAAALEDALTNQVKAVTPGDNDRSRGYGYFFSHSVMKNAIRCDGAFSQLAVAFKDYDASVVCTCCEPDEKKTRDCIFRHFPAAFIDDMTEKPGEEYNLTLPDMPSLTPGDHCITEGLIKSRVIRTSRNAVLGAVSSPVSVLPVTSYTFGRGSDIDNVMLEFDGEECTMVWDEGRDHNSILCGMDGSPRTSRIHLGGMDYTVSCSAAWQDFENLEIWVRPLEAAGERRIVININMLKNKAEITASTYPASAKPSSPAGDIAGNLLSLIDNTEVQSIKGKIKF